MKSVEKTQNIALSCTELYDMTPNLKSEDWWLQDATMFLLSINLQIFLSINLLVYMSGSENFVLSHQKSKTNIQLMIIYDTEKH